MTFSYTASLLKDVKAEVVDLNDYEIPLYSVDRQKELGIPEQAEQFYKKIGDADALLISYAEHNGFYTAVYKNLFDWASALI
ncbi:MAG: NAD(P)H-dependent oxidoreductase [Deinococcota bacterium]